LSCSTSFKDPERHKSKLLETIQGKFTNKYENINERGFTI